MIARPMGRFLRILSVTLITAGLVILADAGITVVWKEPLSAAYNTIRQGTADDQLVKLREDFLGDSRVIELGPARDIDKRADKLAGIYLDGLETGKPMGRIKIPSIGVDYAVIEGTGDGDLQKGPGRYPTTGLPGQGRTVAIAGHRTTYGAPFNQIDGVDVGDEITIETPYADFTYTVTDYRIVEPTDVHIVDDIGRERLVLTACHPLYSAAQRYAVFADLTDTSLFPGGTGTWKAP